jgi:ABC-type nitrate/sulfonate/bicarbonate transport system substrate-binding protein
VGEATLNAKRDAIRRFIDATVHAMSDILADPQVGLEDAIAVVPELGNDREGQLAVLEATAEMWRQDTNEHGLAWVDRDAWVASLEFMRGLPDSNIPADLTVDDLITQEFSE